VPLPVANSRIAVPGLADPGLQNDNLTDRLRIQVIAGIDNIDFSCRRIDRDRRGKIAITRESRCACAYQATGRRWGSANQNILGDDLIRLPVDGECVEQIAD
jgi:hypothetical protein